eukprot:jgi/Bigna1/125732/aug1.1_g440
MEGGEIYTLKKVRFRESQSCPICLQTRNGPCPLIAMFNILSLRGQLKLDPQKVSRGFLTSRDLLDIVGDFLMVRNRGIFESKDGVAANQRQILTDIMSNVLPKLQGGLDVNVKFGGVKAFEYTQELDAFYMLGMDLIHGWVVDKDNQTLHNMLANLSYNQMTDLIVDVNSKLEALESKLKEKKGVDDKKGGNLVPQVVKVEVVKNIENKKDGESIHVPGGAAITPLLKTELVSTAKKDNNKDIIDGPPSTKMVQKQNGESDALDESKAVTEEAASSSSGVVNEGPTLDNKVVEAVKVMDISEDHEEADSAQERSSALACETNKSKPPPPPQVVQVHVVIEKPTADEKSKIIDEVGALRIKKRMLMEFLKISANQLTFCGLSKLHEEVPEGSLCVFFRNNHFAVLHKHAKELYLLVTDIAFKGLPIVWEKLSTVDGDTLFTNSEFYVQINTQKDVAIAATEQKYHSSDEKESVQEDGKLTDEEIARRISKQEQELRDARLAQELQQQDISNNKAPAGVPYRPPNGQNAPSSSSRPMTDEELARQLYAQELQQSDAAATQAGGVRAQALSDEELARRLQAEESRARAPVRTQSLRRVQPHRQKKKKKCHIM